MANSSSAVWFCPQCETVLLLDEEQGRRSNSGAIQTAYDGRLAIRCIVCGTDMHRVPEAALAAFDALKEQKRREATERLGG